MDMVYIIMKYTFSTVLPIDSAYMVKHLTYGHEYK
jgi:hypothetical protein